MSWLDFDDEPSLFPKKPARKKGSQGGSSRISKLYKLDAKELDREVQRLTLLKNECLELCPHMGKEDDLGGIEYKWRLKDITCARFQHLVTQMNFRLQEGMGEARYLLGVEDDGNPRGVIDSDMAQTLCIHRAMVQAVGRIAANALYICTAQTVRTLRGQEGKVVEVAVSRLPRPVVVSVSQWLRVAVIGGVGSGKSSLVSVLTSFKLDNGRGSARVNVLRHAHEITLGRTSAASYHLMGFSQTGDVTNNGGGSGPASDTMEKRNGDRPSADLGSLAAGDEHEWGAILRRSSKIVTFIDLAGHKHYLSTTVYGMTSQIPDYCLVAVEASEGIAPMTMEHMGLAVALGIPVFVVLTKMDSSTKTAKSEKAVGEAEAEAVSPLGSLGSVLGELQALLGPRRHIFTIETEQQLQQGIATIHLKLNQRADAADVEAPEESKEKEVRGNKEEPKDPNKKAPHGLQPPPQVPPMAAVWKPSRGLLASSVRIQPSRCPSPLFPSSLPPSPFTRPSTPPTGQLSPLCTSLRVMPPLVPSLSLVDEDTQKTNNKSPDSSGKMPGGRPLPTSSSNSSLASDDDAAEALVSLPTHYTGGNWEKKAKGKEAKEKQEEEKEPEGVRALDVAVGGAGGEDSAQMPATAFAALSPSTSTHSAFSAPTSSIVPVFLTSSVTGEGLHLLRRFLSLLPKRKAWEAYVDQPAQFHLAQHHSVPGVGTVVSGVLKRGHVTQGDTLLLGPFAADSAAGAEIAGEQDRPPSSYFMPVSVRSIHFKRNPVAGVQAGQACSFALRHSTAFPQAPLSSSSSPLPASSSSPPPAPTCPRSPATTASLPRSLLRKGMVLTCPSLQPRACRGFTAQVTILRHPSALQPGQQFLLHVGCVRQAAKVVAVQLPTLGTTQPPLPSKLFVGDEGGDGIGKGQTGHVTLHFLKREEWVSIGGKFVIMEGTTRGVGRVSRLIF